MRWLLSLVLVLAFVACTSPVKRAQKEADEALAQGRIEEAEVKLEEVRRAEPDNFDLRMSLANLHYVKARRALAAGDQATYASELALAYEEALAAVEIDPEDASPHLLMAVISAYRGDMDSSLTSFETCARLEPLVGVHYGNLAEMWIYQGRVSRARRMLDRARKLRAHPSQIDHVEILTAWRRGDMVEARDAFNIALGIPGFADQWNLAPLPEPMETFEDYQKVCCNDVICGQGMQKQCHLAEIQVEQRRRDEETIRKELQMEMERRRRLREIYERRRDLEVVIEPEGEEE